MKTHIRIALLLAIAAAVIAGGAATAYASLANEVNAGKAVAARVDAGTATCQNLTNTEFEHLGEYVMDRTIGSRATHEAMNAHMDAVMGPENADRMHAALGRRYAGCTSGGGIGPGAGMMGSGGMMGGGMMSGGVSGARGWGAMMGSQLSWMRDGTWQHMTRGDWDRVGAHMMGQHWMHNSGGGSSTGTVIGIALGALALGGVIVYAALRRPWRSGPARPRTVQ